MSGRRAFESDKPWSEILQEIESDPVARAGFVENDLRREIGRALTFERERRSMSMRELADAMSTSLSQVQRVLHEDIGGTITLRTLVRAANALELRPVVRFMRAVPLARRFSRGQVIQFPLRAQACPRVVVRGPDRRKLAHRQTRQTAEVVSSSGARYA